MKEISAYVKYLSSIRCHPRLPITLWSRTDSKGVSNYNHLEDGHSEASRPRPKSEGHLKAWSGDGWTKVYGHLIGGVVHYQEQP